MILLQSGMKILLINPNTSEFVTERAVAAARAAASPDTAIDGVTGTVGAPIINSEADLAIGAYSALELAAKHAGGYDAVGLAVSFDCGLSAIREILDVPVVGLAEASIRRALSLGDRLALLSFGERTRPLYRDLALKYADERQLAGVSCIPGLPASDLKDAAKLRMRAEEAVGDAIQQTDCDTVVLLATAFAGMGSGLSVQTPVVDCVEALIEVLEECVSDPDFGKAFASAAFPERKRILGASAELENIYQNFPDF